MTALIEADRRCAAPDCDEKLGSRQRKWHSEACRQRVYRAERSGRVITTAAVKGARRDNAGREGDVLATLVSRGLIDDIVDGRLSAELAAEAIGYTRSAVTRAAAAWVNIRAELKQRDGWEMGAEAIRQLGNDLEEPHPSDTEAFEEYLEELVGRFVQFRARFRTRKRKRYLTKRFHRKWIKEILRAIVTGERLMILSPPRHGKTDLLIHFVVWMICRDPNVAIVWVSKSTKVARRNLAAVKDHLENNRELIDMFCGPGMQFKPRERSGRSWGAEEITVANRDVTGNKAPTLSVFGRATAILSIDVDLMIQDDIEDHKSTINDATRAQTREWQATQIESREEGDTVMVMIGSRQHWDDIYGYQLDDPEWTTIVEQAHSDECHKDPYVENIHTDCMLFIEVFDYALMMKKKRSYESKGLAHLFKMVYLNKAAPEGLAVFTEEAIRLCYDYHRSLGLRGLPPDSHLVAGLDPSDTGYQSAFLWAYSGSQERWYMVDSDNTLGGGVAAAKQIIKLWHEMYGLRHWIIEENGFQKAIRLDTEIVNFCNQNAIITEGHETHKNKWDPFYGVGAMAGLFEGQKVSLPMGSPESVTKVMVYQGQLIGFSRTAGANRAAIKRGYKSDLVMASWFPQKAIRRFQKEENPDVIYEYDVEFAGYDLIDIEEVPW